MQGEQHARRSAEPGEIPDIRRVRHEQGVESRRVQPAAQCPLAVTPSIGQR
jgi:hypothetical protein